MAFVFAVPLLLAACSMAMPGGQDAPATTGSVAVPVAIQRPLPPSLAYSDASKIGEAAAAAFRQAEGSAAEDWINSATGSSGTVETASAAGDCRMFSTTVTSIGGVHRYSGEVCAATGGRSRVRIDERSPEDRS